jgi:hypothetical protein
MMRLAQAVSQTGSANGITHRLHRRVAPYNHISTCRTELTVAFGSYWGDPHPPSRRALVMQGGSLRTGRRIGTRGMDGSIRL